MGPTERCGRLRVSMSVCQWVRERVSEKERERKERFVRLRVDVWLALFREREDRAHRETCARVDVRNACSAGGHTDAFGGSLFIHETGYVDDYVV